MRSETSYRTIRNKSLAKHLQILPVVPDEVSNPTWKEIAQLREKGADPYAILEGIIQNYGIDCVEVQDCIRCIGAGSSPWIQISHFLLKMRPATVL